ncbi:DUF4157 domain-containing protein [Streptomyces sp. NPDC056061]|uniref:eCIS core domain-containing protein n=1 Tax=Streptomyces sp. NPDC056061 TaxID=3345700 RepID=UPI0035E03AC1
MTMHAQEWDQEHDHGRDHGHVPEREEHGTEQDYEGAPAPRASGGAEAVDTSRVFRAAATGRADAVGVGGMGVLQRTVGNSAVGAMVQRQEGEDRSPVHDVVSSGGGQPLDTDTRTDMERRMGADFSDVRVHTDSAAHESAKSVGAHAYTVGNNVVFQRDAYEPSSPQGRTTLAHELTHVIQQRSGPVDGAQAPGGIRVSDPSDRFEREAVANADRVLSDPAPAPDAAWAPDAVSAPESVPAPESVSAAGTTTASAGAPAVQRASTEDEDEEPADVQGSFVQRAEEGSSEEEEEESPPA